MNKPELSTDGILSIQFETADLTEMYGVFSYFLKTFYYEFEEIYESEVNIFHDEQIVEIFYDMVDVFNESTNFDFELFDEDTEILLESDISFLDQLQKDFIIEYVNNFLVTYFNADWTQDDLRFAFLVNNLNGFGLRIETAGRFVDWLEGADLWDDYDLPFEAIDEINEIKPPSVKPEKPRKIRRKSKREKRSDDMNEMENPFALTPEQQAEVDRKSDMMEEAMRTPRTKKAVDDDLDVAPFHSDQEIIREITDSIIGRAVQAGFAFYPLTSAQWQDVRDVIAGAAFIAMYANNEKVDYKPTIRDVAQFLYNHNETGTLTASMYLLTQSILGIHETKRVESLREVTALLRYYDWLKIDVNKERDNQVYTSILHVTTMIMTGKL